MPDACWIDRLASATPGRWRRAILALAVGLLGVANVMPEIAYRFGWSSETSIVMGLTRDLTLGHIGSLPETAAGIVLLVMSVGLVSGSRFAWAMTLLMTVAIVLRRLVHESHLTPLVFVIALLIVALVQFRHSFDRSSIAAETSFAVLSLLSLLGFSVSGTYLLEGDFSPPVDDLLTALYFSVATLSTVGYGDIIPKTAEARVFVMSVIVIGVSIFATSLSTVVIPLVNKRLRDSAAGAKALKRTQHAIVVGDTPLARSTVLSLHARGIAVTRIADRPADETADTPGDEIDDLVVGDPTERRTLERAGIVEAIALLTLTADDAQNAFIVLAARETGTKARTTVSVTTTANLARVRLAAPDIVIAPELFSGDMLAMSISGEAIEPSTLIKRIFNRAEPDG